MKLFIYDPESCWPSDKPKPGAQLRVDALDCTTEDPDEADFLIVPWPIYDYEYHNVNARLHVRHLERREHKHVWLEIADCYTNHTTLVGNGVFCLCNLNTARLSQHPNAMPIAWPVDDLEAYAAVPADGFAFDVVFQGWESCPTRTSSAISCQVSGLRAHVQLYSEFYGYYEQEDRGRERRASFLQTLQQSMVGLAPRSIPGVFPYRFWEAMSAARIPALVCDDYVLPLADRIPYNEFCIFISEADAGRAGQIIGDWLSARPVDEVIERGKMARECWSKWLDTRRWATVIRHLLEERVSR